MTDPLRILFIGDIVGRPGLQLIKTHLPKLRQRERLDAVVANAENVSGGSGLLPSAYRQLIEAGVDLVTLGDHIYKKDDIIPVLQSEESICKPANFPPGAPGREYAIRALPAGLTLAAVCVLGRTYMRPVDCPFLALDRVLESLKDVAQIVIVDLHAETTADKYLLANYLDGRVAAALGTHTHVPTADEQIMPKGTAFICDVGMTGPYASVLGRRVDRVLSTTMTFIPSAFDVAEGDVRLGGAILEVDRATGLARRIQRVMWRETDLAAIL